jgi:hypothetical protein
VDSTLPRDYQVVTPHFIGDYVGMDNDGEDFLPFWSQPFGGDPANAFVRRVGLVG